ncbi:MAG: FtsQ-type POTRA domain-containing protein [Clostridia bacterium]|nr:FtsQ-type POTRA domain-containing protein [Clostridia bacterium]
MSDSKDNMNENKKVNNEEKVTKKVKLSDVAIDKPKKVVEKESSPKKVSSDTSKKETNEDTPKRKVVSLSEVAKEKEREINSKKEAKEDEPKREKVKLDELIKQTKDTDSKKDKKKDSKDDVIVSFNEEKNQVKSKIKQDKQKEQKEKKELDKKTKEEIKELGGSKEESDSKKKKEKKEEAVKEELNLDVLGVKRAKGPNILLGKIKEAFITVLLILVGLFIIMIMPFFNVNDVNVTGLDLVAKEEVLNVIGYNKSKNIWHLMLNKPEAKINTLPMVNSCETKFRLPSTLDVRVSEIRIAGYIPYLSEYIYIDSNGKVVNITNEKIDGIPLIEGLNFHSFKLGNILEVSNEEALNIIIEITNVLNKYNLSNSIDSIDVTSLDNLKLYVGNIEVILGEIEDYDQKIRLAMEAISNLSEEAKGILNVSSASGKIYFRPYS